MVFLLLSVLLAIGTNDVVSGQQCATHIQDYKVGLALGKIWALQMLDSSAKFPDGVMAGMLMPPGNFDECLRVRAPEFQGKYCKVYVDVVKGKGPITESLPTFEIATCGPSSCSDEEIAQVAEFNLGTLGIQVSATTKALGCDYEGSRTLDTGAWIAISICLFLVLLAVLAGICDWYFEKFEKTPPPAVVLAVTAFSLRSNLKQVFHISRKTVPGQVPCLHGLRVFSIAWVVLGHRYETFSYGMPHINSFEALQAPQQYSSVPIINALFAVDTFFLLGGFLVTYMFCREMLKGKKFNPIQYYVYRYLRLTVPLAAVILFISFIMIYLGTGPLWNSTFTYLSNNCKKSWWATMLYINNYYDMPTYDICLPMSWYLSVDMQLSWAAPILLLPLARWPKYTLIALGLLLFTSTALNFGLVYAYEFFWTYPVINFPKPTSQMDYYSIAYVTPWMRAQPYLIGMALGWYMSTPRKPMKRMWAVLVWFVSSACCLAVLFTIIIAYQPDHPYNVTEAAFYNSLHRLVWGLSVAWVIYACSHGLGGPADWILSWKYFQPLSKLSYCVYLTHMFLIFAETGYQRTPFYFSHAVMIHGLMADLVIIFPISLVLYVLTEAPTMNLLRKLFGKDKKVVTHIQERLNNDKL